jgi:xylulokinase
VTEPLQCVPSDGVITGWDFSTGAVKCLAFDLDGNTLTSIRLPTDLWTAGGVSELNLMQLEGQARACTRALANRLRTLRRLDNWVAGGVSATHHTSGRIDADRVQVRRAICWNDHTLAMYHARGVERLGGPAQVRELIGGPWAIRYSLSHLVKDEETLDRSDWERTFRILPHGALSAGYLTSNFDVVSVSAAASTGLLDLRSCRWRREMLVALTQPEYRELAWQTLPKIIDQNEPIGPLSPSLALELGLDPKRKAPLVFPTSDDQAAGLVGGGAVDDGQLAVILGNSAVVNSSAGGLPSGGELDVMRLNWGPYLWMRCYNNGAQFLDTVVGARPDWAALEVLGQGCPAGCNGVSVLPFANPEPSLGVTTPHVRWTPTPPTDSGVRFRASLEALAYLIAWGVREHEQAGQRISRLTVSGGIARSDLMCQILASVLNRPLHRLVSFEGPALGAAVTALAAMENHLRRQKNIGRHFTVSDAVARMVKFRDQVAPNPAWRQVYAEGFKEFEGRVKG